MVPEYDTSTIEDGISLSAALRRNMPLILTEIGGIK